MTSRLLLAAVVLACCWRGGPAIAQNSTDAAFLRVTLRSNLLLPDTAVDQDGNEIRITGLSGITWLGESRYAAIMDNSNVILTFRLTVSPSGDPVEVKDLVARTLSEQHDYEDIVPCPPALERRIVERQTRNGGEPPGRCLLVVEESTPAIRAVSLERGDLLGVVPIPTQLAKPRPNRGLESLAVDPDGSRIWTANEEALPADGPAATESSGTVVRLASIGVTQAADGTREQTRQFAYTVDPPHPFLRIFNGEPLSGVVSLVSLGHDRLLLLERSGCPGLPPFKNRMYLVDARDAADISAVDKNLVEQNSVRASKTLLWQDRLGRNFEGLCMGPELGAGQRLLVAISDNGATGLPNQLVTFVLEDSQQAPGLATIAIVGLGLLLIPGLFVLYRLGR